MKHILLAGGAGYIGSVLCSHFLRKGYQVTILDNFIYDHHFAMYPYMGDPNFKLVCGNLNEISKLAEASKDVTDVIILGGLVGDPITKKYPDLSKQINDGAVKTCIDFFSGKGISKLIFISTCSNYGMIKDNELADEEFELRPLSLYAEAKVSNEKYLLSRKDSVDYTGVILRFATAFGLSPRMRFDLSISEFVRDLYFGEELVIYDENTWRPYCHVRDFARALDTVISADNSIVDFQVFNAGGDVNNYTKKMIIDEILNHLPGRKVKYGTNGSDPRNYKVSFSKINKLLGFEPEYNVPRGIQELLSALNMGFYADSFQNKNKYGNYQINQNIL